MFYIRIVLGVVVLFMLASCGGGGGSDSDEVVPIARDDSFSLEQGNVLSSTVASNDSPSADGGNRWRLLSETTYGVLVFNDDGRFSYTHDAGFLGEDGFVYEIVDANGSSSTAIAFLNVNLIAAINDPLFSEQWYLDNTGQTTNTGTGTLGADIGVLVGGTGAEDYAQGYTGDGIQIAIIDTGLEIAHVDLAPNVMKNGSYNFAYTGDDDKQFDPTATNTDGDHGTSVAGLVGARGGNAEGIWGVAPSAELKGFNFLANQGFNVELASLGWPDSVSSFSGLSSMDVDVFNRSYGRNPVIVPVEPSTLFAVFENIIGALELGAKSRRSGKGAIYVKAAGNEFKSVCVNYSGDVCTEYADCTPADNNDVTCYNVNMESENATPYQMVIGAFNANDVRASYSNTGSALWLVAPGGEHLGMATTDQSGCLAGYHTSTIEGENCDYHYGFAGTSAATPIVSGAVALLLEANPDLSWRDVKHILATTARKIDDPGLVPVPGSGVMLEAGWVVNAAGYHFSNAYGFGALSVDAAISMALKWKDDSETLPAMKVIPIAPVEEPINIPDYDQTGNTQTSITQTSIVTEANVADVAESVTLTLSIEAISGTDIDISDYQIILESANGTQSILMTPFNAYQADYNMKDLTIISHAFYGEPINGDWQLIIRDLDDGIEGAGKLTEWSLKFYGHES
jgi:subtilisin family serine protease